MNRITLIGNLVHSPELRTTQTGKNVCNFSIAVNRRYKGENGERQADFFNVQVWGAQAEACAQFLEKGRKVGVIGSMQSRQYDAKDGTKKTAWDVVADEVEFLTPREGGTGQNMDSGRAHRDYDEMKRQAAQVEPAEFTVVDDEELPF